MLSDGRKLPSASRVVSLCNTECYCPNFLRKLKKDAWKTRAINMSKPFNIFINSSLHILPYLNVLLLKNISNTKGNAWIQVNTQTWSHEMYIQHTTFAHSLCYCLYRHNSWMLPFHAVLWTTQKWQNSQVRVSNIKHNTNYFSGLSCKETQHKILFLLNYWI